MNVPSHPHRSMMQQAPGLLPAMVLAAGLTCAGSPARAVGLGWVGREDVDQTATELLASPTTYHYHYKADHRPVWMIGGAVVEADGRLKGLSVFSNSFGQLSAYGFVGHKYVEPFGWTSAYWAWTAGLIYGYHGEYKDQAGISIGGFSPVIVPRLGYRVSPRVALELQPLGLAAMMFSVAIDLP
jgi:hypothetical protein